MTLCKYIANNTEVQVDNGYNYYYDYKFCSNSMSIEFKDNTVRSNMWYADTCTHLHAQYIHAHIHTQNRKEDIVQCTSNNVR